MIPLSSPQSHCAQDEKHDDDETNDIDDAVHRALLILSTVPVQTVRDRTFNWYQP